MGDLVHGRSGCLKKRNRDLNDSEKKRMSLFFSFSVLHLFFCLSLSLSLRSIMVITLYSLSSHENDRLLSLLRFNLFDYLYIASIIVSESIFPFFRCRLTQSR